jgi:hypothetical protein
MSAEVGGQTISVQCPCGKRLKAPASAVGRKAKCPKCGNVLTVQAPKPAAREAMDDALYDLAADAQSAAAASPPSIAPPPLPPSRPAAKPAATARVGAAFPPALQTKVQVEKPAPTGTMLKGAIISAVFAFVGALVWFGIAKATHREIGWIAWGVGIAAGFGMMIGYNGTSVSAGAVAAMFSVGGILLGKWMVFSSVVLPMFSGMLTKASSQIGDDDKLHVYVVNQQLEKKGLNSNTATDEQSEAAGKEAERVIAKMDARTKAAETAKAKESFKRFESRLMEEIPRSTLFFKTMFDPMDLLFFVIAIASAFKVATFGGEVDNS